MGEHPGLGLAGDRDPGGSAGTQCGLLCDRSADSHYTAYTAGVVRGEAVPGLDQLTAGI